MALTDTRRTLAIVSLAAITASVSTTDVGLPCRPDDVLYMSCLMYPNLYPTAAREYMKTSRLTSGILQGDCLLIVLVATV